MKYVVSLEAAFRKCEETYEMNSLISSVKIILNMHDNDELNDTRDSHTVLERGLIHLPEASEVKYPGRPKKITRYSSLRKDFAKAAFRRKYLGLKNKLIEENEHKDVIEEEVKAGIVEYIKFDNNAPDY